MTIIIDHRPVRRTSRWFATEISGRQARGPVQTWLSTSLSALGHWISSQQRAYRRRQTERMLEALPFDLRKDLGWPASDMQKPERN
ncbi:hypothetical protein [Rhizobium straminoryzae]|uniref:DUF1127 domain-containing protein n=1 Tax=Rhizobium straminoryzae TaxID=1387186 RepID=A0A549TD25_9HYPH|nr:hypothetical protein [Rhizobium straminoryzae]TRL39864.1 hypothetical protein FNA46_07985 [Rhizobium straminoryzae]